MKRVFYASTPQRYTKVLAKLPLGFSISVHFEARFPPKFFPVSKSLVFIILEIQEEKMIKIILNESENKFLRNLFLQKRQI